MFDLAGQCYDVIAGVTVRREQVASLYFLFSFPVIPGREANPEGREVGSLMFSNVIPRFNRGIHTTPFLLCILLRWLPTVRLRTLLNSHTWHRHRMDYPVEPGNDGGRKLSPQFLKCASLTPFLPLAIQCGACLTVSK